jgi:hypothetical protein
MLLGRVASFGAPMILQLALLRFWWLRLRKLVRVAGISVGGANWNHSVDAATDADISPTTVSPSVYHRRDGKQQRSSNDPDYWFAASCLCQSSLWTGAIVKVRSSSEVNSSITEYPGQSDWLPGAFGVLEF